MKANQVFAIGDLHGSFKPVRDFYKYNNQSLHLDENDNFLIILGDAGLNFFFNHRDEEIKKKLNKYPFTYFIIRGNHEQRPSICAKENPTEWHKELFWNNLVYVENEYPYIKYASDKPNIYYLPKDAETGITSIKTLVIPGAYSVDKYKRLEAGWSWFEQEQLTSDEMAWGWQIIETDPKYDLVLSHTCPIIFEPTDLFLDEIDQSMVDKTMERYLGEIEFKIDYKLWLWGHYHADRVYPKTDGHECVMLFNSVINIKDWLNGNEQLISSSFDFS